MSHSVEQHLGVSPANYDVEIRRLVPGYDAMLAEVLAAVAEHLPAGEPRILELGPGSGRLSVKLAEQFAAARLILLDLDAAMLALAGTRLAAMRHRVELRQGSFSDVLPQCEAVVASLALHHVLDRDAKLGAYRNIRRALAPGGALVIGDVAVPAATELSELVMARWAAHLVQHGDTEAEAFARFAQWAEQERYFGVDEELGMLREAGFERIDVRWRAGPMAVFVALS